MNCETCGNPIDRNDAERGSCGHCGAVLAHVLRAAEKAELVRRVVAQGNDVRIDGDSIEARAPPGPRREGPEGAILEARSMSFGVAAALGITLAAGLVAYVAIVHRSLPPTAPPLPTAAPKALIAEPVPPVAAAKPLLVERPAPMPTLAVKELEPAAKTPPPPRAPAAAAPRTVEGVVAAHKPEYDRCQRAELARNASAARRYSLAITVDTQGRAEWVELLSEASSEMRLCVQAVTRGLDFPKAAAGSSRSIVTLSFTVTP